MPPYLLPFAIHNHQPVGNFESVFARAVDNCYRPFLEGVLHAPYFRFSLHFSGPLWEWMEAKRPEVLALVKEMVDRGQVELLGGGFYEPLLPYIPERDAVGQILLMSDYLEEHFLRRPKGIWLAERVWDPSLPRLLRPLGIEYTLLDDAHFLNACLPSEQIKGYFVTEREGEPLAVFPIRQELRYLIPFREPKEVLDLFRSFPPSECLCLAYGDDGEKFGVWPGTREWVYVKGWLRRFLRFLEERQDLIEVLPLGDCLERLAPEGRLYLPPASYEELTEWALMPDDQKAFSQFVEELKGKGLWQRYRPFLRGGSWDGFLRKYEEANLMHKKMIQVSRHLERSPHREAMRELWRGQCNCAYWHGLFGGIYMNHLRHAVYRHLLVAESLLQHESEVRVEDIDCDGYEEWLYSSPLYNLYVKPHYGGAVFELDLLPPKVNLTSVVARHKEAYHEKIAASVPVDEGGQVKSIHETFRVKEEDLFRHLLYDRFPRFSFFERLLRKGTGWEEMWRQTFVALHEPFHYLISGWEKEEGGAELRMVAEGEGFRAQKVYRFRDDPPQIKINLLLRASLSALLSWEINFNLLSPGDPRRYLLIRGERIAAGHFGEWERIGSLSVVDEAEGWRGMISSAEPFSLWLYPVETVNLTEEGAQKTYQGSCLTLVREFGGGEMEWSLILRFSFNKKGSAG